MSKAASLAGFATAITPPSDLVVGIVTASNVSVASSVTATTFYGSGENLTGIAVTANISADRLVVAGVTTVSAGSAAAPSIVTNGDPNTGIFFPAADSIAVSNGGAEAARIDSSGRLLVGTNSARSNLYNSTLSALAQFEDTDSPRIAVISSSNVNGRGGAIVLAHQVSNTVGGNTVVSNGDQIGSVEFQGSDGAEFVQAAKIDAFVDGTPGANDMPGRLVFSTARDGTSTPVEWLRLDSSGRFGAFGRLNGNNYYGSVGYYADAHTVCRTFGVDSTSTAWADQKSALFVHGNFGAGGNNQVPCASLTVLNWPSGSTNPGAIMRGWKGDASLLEGTPVLQFQVNHNGNVTNTNNSYGSLSDIRYKQDITLAGSQWEDIKNISIKKFRFIDDVKNETEENPAPYLLGCIAQEVAEVSPGLVEVRGDDKDEDGNVIPEVLTLKYSVLYMKAIKALQEAQERIETLEAQNTTQASAIEALTARLDAAGL